MWSFIATVAICLILLVIGSLLQRKERRQIKDERTRVNEDIHKVAEIAQRRHRAKFGHDDTGLNQALNGKDKVKL